MDTKQEYQAAVMQQDWDRAAWALRFEAEQRNIAAVEEMLELGEWEDE